MLRTPHFISYVATYRTGDYSQAATTTYFGTDSTESETNMAFTTVSNAPRGYFTIVQPGVYALSVRGYYIRTDTGGRNHAPIKVGIRKASGDNFAWTSYRMLDQGGGANDSRADFNVVGFAVLDSTNTLGIALLDGEWDGVAVTGVLTNPVVTAVLLNRVSR